jgi:hypothetical protein
MATVTNAEEQILKSLDELSPEARREAIRRLLPSAGWLEREVERNQSRIEALARQRGLEWSELTEEEREHLIDELLHE